MKYNDETLDLNRFDEIAREYNKQLVRIVVKTESLIFEEVIRLAGRLLGVAARARFRYIKNNRFKEFYNLLKAAVRLLSEFCQGECGQNIEQIHSDLSISDIHKLLGELISKLIRIEITDSHKKEIFHNIIDRFLEILLKFIEGEQTK
ncbi:MAG: hypothetical protein LBN07_00460 [Christensenellaceae bacterium]|jgi:phenylalanyl-tRNA synthetase beta subunit|nr:hypothetical protein [Christensenellaceae bacterium]